MNIDTKWVDSDGVETSLEAGFNPVAGNGTDSPSHDIDLAAKTLNVSDGMCALRLYIYRLGNTKQVGIANMEIGLHLVGKSGISDIEADNPTIVTYYNMNGIQGSKCRHGIIIRKEINRNGLISTRKYINH